MVAVFKGDGGGAPEARDKRVAAHFANEFVVASHGKSVVDVLNEEVGNGRVVRGMLAVVTSAITKTSLIGFT